MASESPLEYYPPGQLPDRPVGPGRRADTSIGHTARPLPIAVADSPIEAASPDRQQPMCYLVEVSVLSGVNAPAQLPDVAVGLGRRADAIIGRTARPLPITVAHSPIEAASPDLQPMRYFYLR